MEGRRNLTTIEKTENHPENHPKNRNKWELDDKNEMIDSFLKREINYKRE